MKVNPETGEEGVYVPAAKRRRLVQTDETHHVMTTAIEQGGPRSHVYVDKTLGASTVGRAIVAIEDAVDEPERFMYLSRVLRALRSVRNVGRAAEIDEMLRSQADADEAVALPMPAVPYPAAMPLRGDDGK